MKDSQFRDEKSMTFFKTKLIQCAVVVGLAFALFISSLYGQGILEKPLCETTRRNKACKTEIKINGQAYKVDQVLGKEDDIAVEQCLVEMLVCNEIVEVATVLTAATQPGNSNSLPTALPPNQQFFLANALYRLHLESRSEVLRCAYGNRAKAQVRDFLASTKRYSDKGGSLLALNMSHIQAALNIMKHLDAPNDCPENPLTLGEIASIVSEFASEHIVEVFTDSKKSDANPVVTKVNSIYALVQEMMSTVSEVETAIQLIDIEYMANHQKLLSIGMGALKKLYCEIGAADCKPIITATTDNKLKLETNLPVAPKALTDATAANVEYAKGAAAISKVETTISELIAKAASCVDSDESHCKDQGTPSKTAAEGYENLRLRLTSDTYYWAAQATHQDYYLRKLLADTDNSASSFKTLMTILKENKVDDDPRDVVQQLQQSFESRYGANCPDFPSWFCCELSPDMPFCKK